MEPTRRTYLRGLGLGSLSMTSLAAAGRERDRSSIGGPQQQTETQSLSLANVLTISGTGPRTRYRFEINGTVEKSGEYGSIQGSDTLDGGAGEGVVGGGTDAYLFEGAITAFAVEEPSNVVVRINGHAIAPSTLGNGSTAVAGSGGSSVAEALFASNGSGIGVVAPSLASAYNSLTAAISAGHREIWLAESIAENGIPIPFLPVNSGGLAIRGVGEKWQTITDPDQDGTPIFDVDTSEYSWDVVMEDIAVEGGEGSGRAINCNYTEVGQPQDGGKRPHRWFLKNCHFDAGPAIVMGGINMKFENTVFNAAESTNWSPHWLSGRSKESIEVGAGLVTGGGTTHRIDHCFFGSAGSQDTRGDVTFMLISCNGFLDTSSIYHYGEATHANMYVDGTRGATWVKPWFESGQLDNDFHVGSYFQDIRNQALGFYQPSTGAGRLILENCYDSVINRSEGGGEIEATDVGGIEVINGRGRWEAVGSDPDDVLIRSVSA
ncbi:hypothetical protein BRC86_04510 [Halobacteriales archaeon QS_3_64_16]|nr:MAG: hypothetical protein BRC86_04510 [Halobacteriales archaeon QS_3_64_16]